MALNIKNPETTRLAHELAAATGETVTQAVTEALRRRVDAVRRSAEHSAVLSDIGEIQAFVASLPDLDFRSGDELLGYDDFGLPA